MFVRIKKSGNHKYLHIVESYRHWGKSKQKMIASLGRLDKYQDSMALHELAHSLLAMYKNIRERQKKSGIKNRKK